MEITVSSVIDAITSLREHKGSSRAALLKYFKAKSEAGNHEDSTSLFSVPLKKALDEGVKSGEIIMVTKQTFKARGVEFDPPKDSTVVIEVLTPPTDPASAPASDGDTVNVAYSGSLLEGGAVFDSAASFEFELGAGEVIKGWDEGIKGMRKGEKRRLTVPPKKAYGKRGSPPEIPSDAWLVFDVTRL